MAIQTKDRHILVVDDDEDILFILSKALQQEGYTVATASSGEAALQILAESTPDLVILDVNMDGISGIQTLETLRRRNNYVAVIFATGNRQPQDVVKGLDAGADDYLKKPFDISEFLSRVRAKLRVKDLNDELRVANKKLKDLVEIDDLTGLFNMRSIYQKLDHEIVRAKRIRNSISVLMMDMDHFKNVNDEHDHLFGSFVLSEVGKIVKNNIRQIDFAARYGGDEFLIILTDAQVEGTNLFAERLRQTIENHLFDNGIDQIRLTASMGFAITHPDAILDARAIVRRADKCLYNAKEAGRNNIKFYDFKVEAEQGIIVDPKKLRRKTG